MNKIYSKESNEIGASLQLRQKNQQLFNLIQV